MVCLGRQCLEAVLGFPPHFVQKYFIAIDHLQRLYALSVRELQNVIWFCCVLGFDCALEKYLTESR
jgi:hypothetical protein